jgi:hypothetical protein
MIDLAVFAVRFWFWWMQPKSYKHCFICCCIALDVDRAEKHSRAFVPNAPDFGFDEERFSASNSLNRLNPALVFLFQIITRCQVGASFSFGGIGRTKIMLSRAYAVVHLYKTSEGALILLNYINDIARSVKRSFSGVPGRNELQRLGRSGGLLT